MPSSPESKGKSLGIPMASLMDHVCMERTVKRSMKVEQEFTAKEKEEEGPGRRNSQRRDMWSSWGGASIAGTLCGQTRERGLGVQCQKLRGL